MKLFLDDVRLPEHCRSYMPYRIGNRCLVYSEPGWIVVRDFEQFKHAVQVYAGVIEVVSFDHDLEESHYTTIINSTGADNPELIMDLADFDDPMYTYSETSNTGYDCAKWMIEYYKIKGLELPEVLVHSMNPVGTKNIQNLFEKTG